MEDDQLAVEISEMVEEVFHNYLCYFAVEGVMPYKSNYSKQEKDIIISHMDLQQECPFEFVDFNGSDFRKILRDLELLIQNYNKEFLKETQKSFKQFMRDYERMGIDYAAISRPKIKNKIKGIRNMRIRYEKNLYPKLEIFYELLDEKVKIQGKWLSVNSAIKDILPELKNRFIEYDRSEIIKNIAINTNNINKSKELLLKDDGESFKYYKKYNLKRKINDLTLENSKLESLLKSNDFSYAIKYKIPFNTEYLDEILMNNLRRNKEKMKLYISS